LYGSRYGPQAEALALHGDLSISTELHHAYFHAAELSLRMRSRKHAFVLNNAHVAMNECEIGEIQKS